MSVNWDRILEKYTGVGSGLIPDDVRKDVLALVQYARVQYQENVKLVAELNGAKQTMLALCIRDGVIEIPFSLVDQIQPTDILHAEDVELPSAEGQPPVKVKRFRLGTKSIVHIVPKVN